MTQATWHQKELRQSYGVRGLINFLMNINQKRIWQTGEYYETAIAARNYDTYGKGMSTAHDAIRAWRSQLVVEWFIPSSYFWFFVLWQQLKLQTCTYRLGYTERSYLYSHEAGEYVLNVTSSCASFASNLRNFLEGLCVRSSFGFPQYESKKNNNNK